MMKWSHEKKTVWHTTKTGKVCQHHIADFSKEDYFYKLNKITEKHILLINVFSSRSGSGLQKNHLEVIKFFLENQLLRERAAKAGMLRKYIEKTIVALECNLMEDRYAIHERQANPILDTLARGDASILEDVERMTCFIAYFGHQITRTKAFKNNLMLSYQTVIGEMGSRLLIKLEECWWLQSYLLGMNIAKSLVSSQGVDQHCLVINSSEEKFITSDNPIINVHPSIDTYTFNAPREEECDLYLPLSPTVGYMINKSNRFPAGVVHIDKNFVEEVNSRIAKNAVMHILGVSKSCIDPYKKFVGEKQNLLKRRHYNKTK